MLLRCFCCKWSIPHPSACCPSTRIWDLLIPGHVCWWDATAYGLQGDEEFMLCQGCGPGRYGLNAISPSALSVPAATAEGRENAVAQIARSTAAISVRSGVYLHVPSCVGHAEQRVQ